jgi:hypothetical protein
MRAFLMSVIVTGLLAAGTAVVLSKIQKDATMAYSTTGARVTQE